jgi:hypothetical protein
MFKPSIWEATVMRRFPSASASMLTGNPVTAFRGNADIDVSRLDIEVDADIHRIMIARWTAWLTASKKVLVAGRKFQPNDVGAALSR